MEVGSMKKKGKIIAVLLAVLLAGIYYYVALPAINIHSSDIWFFVIVLLVVIAVLYAIKKKVGKGEFKQNKVLRSLFYLIVAVGIIYLIGSAT